MSSNSQQKYSEITSKSTQSEKSIVALILPLYYCADKISDQEHNDAVRGWNDILNDKSQVYLENKAEHSFSHSSCVVFFYDTFYGRLFDVHPQSQKLFTNGIKGQGRFLVQMLSVALNAISSDTEKLDKALTTLAEVHYTRGVKCVDCKYLLNSTFF